jgi:hypothetical protein
MKIEVLVRKYIIDKAKDFTFDRVSGCAPFIGGRGEYIQAARMRKTKGHCLDLQCELGQHLRLPWWKANILVKENGRGVGAERSVGIRESGWEIFGHGWYV